MKPKTRHITLSFAAILLVILGAWALLPTAGIYRVHRDVDVNTGDIRKQSYVCFARVKDEIETSPFSQEIRRLGIGVDKERVWKRAGTRLPGRGFVCFRYGGAVANCDLLVRLLDGVETPDEDRRVILQGVLTSLQTGDLAAIDKQLQALAEKL